MQAVQVSSRSTFYLQPVSDIQVLTVRDIQVLSSQELSPPTTEHASSIAFSVDEHEDSLQCVTELMRQHPKIARVNLMIHARSEGLYLGKTCLNAETLERYAWDLQEWFAGTHHSTMGDRPRIHIHVLGVRDIKQLNSITNTLVHLTGAEVRIFDL